MFEEVRIRERKSAKHGKTYEYRFEIAPVGGERKWISKGGFLSEEDARTAGIEAWKRYCLCGLSERPSDISYADFLDEWMEKECKFNLKETTLLNYRKRMLRRRGLAPKYEHPGIYCIKLDNQLVYIGKSKNMLERVASHYVGIKQGSELKYRIIAEA